MLLIKDKELSSFIFIALELCKDISLKLILLFSSSWTLVLNAKSEKEIIVNKNIKTILSTFFNDFALIT
ncbi:hypothetical protein BN164_1000039 [Clostridioides difficile T20]|nr:hypothetical protein BN164_1000039 [Clostridioides difficile T20]CCK98236.1 hypothetical protein BN166_1290010 [Clostridioides difficile E10]